MHISARNVGALIFIVSTVIGATLLASFWLYYSGQQFASIGAGIISVLLLGVSLNLVAMLDGKEESNGSGQSSEQK